MSQQMEDNIKTFLAGADLEAYRRVKLNAGSGEAVVYAGDEEAFIGITQTKVLSGERVPVALKTTGRTFKAVAASAISAGASFYGAANGKIEGAGTVAQGRALEAATADGDVIEVLPA